MVASRALMALAILSLASAAPQASNESSTGAAAAAAGAPNRGCNKSLLLDVNGQNPLPFIRGPQSPFGPQDFVVDGVVLFPAVPSHACTPVQPIPANVTVGGCSYPTGLVITIENGEGCSQETKAHNAANTAAAVVVFLETRPLLREYAMDYGFIGSHWSMSIDGTGSGIALPSLVWSELTSSSLEMLAEGVAACYDEGKSWCTPTVFRVEAEKDEWRTWTASVYWARLLFVSPPILYFVYRCARNVVLSRRIGKLSFDPRSVAVALLSFNAVIELANEFLQPVLVWVGGFITYDGLDSPPKDPAFIAWSSGIFLLRGGLITVIYLLTGLMMREVGQMSTKKARHGRFFQDNRDKRIFLALVLTTIFLCFMAIMKVSLNTDGLAIFTSLYTLWVCVLFLGTFVCFLVFGKKLFLALNSLSVDNSNQVHGLRILRMVRQACGVTIFSLIGLLAIFAGLFYVPIGYKVGSFVVPFLLPATGIALERSVSGNLNKLKKKGSVAPKQQVTKSSRSFSISDSAASGTTDIDGASTDGGASTGYGTEESTVGGDVSTCQDTEVTEA